MAAHREVLLAEAAGYRLTSHRLVQGDTEVTCEPGRLVYRRGDTVLRELPLAEHPLPSAPRYAGSIPVLAAAYRLALQELAAGISPEGLMPAGANWASVWTRDVAYAATLGADIAAPDAVRRSLESRVRHGVVVQDTGTGGGWPVSTDRVVWAMGAYAYAQVTGDADWLRYAAEVLTATLAQDAAVLPQGTPLRPGETSFLDWREQSYPAWMSTADIGASYALSTNILYFICLSVLAKMLRRLGREAEAAQRHREALVLAEAIEAHFWNPGTRRYNMLYRPGEPPEERSDALASALAVLSGVAGEHAAELMEHLPRSPWGTPVFAPYKAEPVQAYHNRAIWPFVEAFVLLAQAELQQTEGAAFSLVSLLRAALAFGTNKENFHAETGRAEDTLLNSDRQLWSVCGMLGAFYRGLFGVQFEGENVVLSPCVPRVFAGSHWLSGLRVRGLLLDIHLNGYGTEIGAVMVNGKPGSPVIPLDACGHWQVEIELMPAEGAESSPAPAATEDLPDVLWDDPGDGALRWHPVPGAESYCIYRDGRAFATTCDCFFPLPSPPRCYHRYSVQAQGRTTLSAPNRPFSCAPAGVVHHLLPERIGEAAEYRVEHGQAWLDLRPCTARVEYEELCLAPEEAGHYRLQLHYANATASKRDGDTCALRELWVDGVFRAVLVLPHHTKAGCWEEDALTAPLELALTPGRHCFALLCTPRCTNGNGELNQCMVRALELTRTDG